MFLPLGRARLQGERMQHGKSRVRAPVEIEHREPCEPESAQLEDLPRARGRIVRGARRGAPAGKPYAREHPPAP